MVTERVAQEEPEDDENPIIAEAKQMNQEGDDADILRDIAELDKAEEGEPPAPPVAEAPPPGPVVPTPPVPPVQPRQPSAEDVLRQRLQQLEAERWESQRKEQEAQLEQQIQVQRRQWEEQGMQPEHAQMMAQRELDFRRRESEIARQAETYVLNLQGKQNAAQYFGRQYRIPAEQLLIYNTPEQMEAAARQMSQMAVQQREIAQLKKQRVPVQTFEAGTPSGRIAATRDDLLDRYLAGDRSPEVVAAASKL